MTQPEEPLGPNWILGSDTGRYLQERAEEPGYLVGDEQDDEDNVSITEIDPTTLTMGEGTFQIFGLALNQVTTVRVGDEAAEFTFDEDESFLNVAPPFGLLEPGIYSVSVGHPGLLGTHMHTLEDALTIEEE